MNPKCNQILIKIYSLAKEINKLNSKELLLIRDNLERVEYDENISCFTDGITEHLDYMASEKER